MSTTSQAQIFAAEYAQNTAREMLDTISGVGKKAGRVSRIVLAVSMPHQIAFILGLAPLAWHSLDEWLASVTLILGSILIPIAVDYLILICIQIIAARGMAKTVKRGAIWVMAFPILLSAAVNVAAPAPPIMRALFGLMVVLIPLAEGLRAFIRPDFSAIEAMENEVAAQLAPAAEPVDEQARARRSESARKAAATRKEREAQAAAVKAEKLEARRARAAAKRLEELAPSSPGHPVLVLSAADKEALAHLDTRAKR